MRIGLDATYSLGKNLSGVGVYSREILFGLAAAHPADQFRFYYRPHRFRQSFADRLPRNSSRRILYGSPQCGVFHALNQRVDFEKNASRRTICTFHDLFVMTGDYSSPDFRARFTAQARQAADRSDAIIAVSQFTASQVEQLLHVNRSRIHVVHHGVHLPIRTPPENARENMVLFAGVIQRRKNVGRLVRAFTAMPAGWRLILAGATEGYGAAEELQAVEASPRRADIQLAGHVSRAELDTLYARARIFAFPSLDEGFGMPVLEAMAHGVPVVTSNTSALTEVASDAALLVDPQNVDEVASALNQLATGEDLRADFIARGLQRARAFPWENAVQRTWDVYNTH